MHCHDHVETSLLPKTFRRTRLGQNVSTWRGLRVRGNVSTPLQGKTFRRQNVSTSVPNENVSLTDVETFCCFFNVETFWCPRQNVSTWRLFAQNVSTSNVSTSRPHVSNRGLLASTVKPSIVETFPPRKHTFRRGRMLPWKENVSTS